LSTIADAGRIYDHIAVLSADGWRLVQPDPQGGGRLLPWSGPTPAASEIVTAMAFPGLVRDVGVLSGVPNAGVPLLLVPSSRAHPLQEAAPEASILRGMSSRAMGELLLRLADRSGADARELRRVQRPWLQRFLLSSALEEWIDRARAQNAEPAGAAR
jgi:hypothetical protein